MGNDLILINRIIKKKVRALIQIYVLHKNKFNKGYGEHINILGIFEKAFIGVAGVKYLFNRPDISLFYIVPIVIISLIYFWVFGHLWDKFKGFDIEAEFSNRRNPTLQKIKKNIKRNS